MDLKPLRRHRDFRSLFAAQFVSFLGSMVTYVALPYQMFKLTGSSLAVGLLGLAELLPLLVTAFVGGALADTVDRRRMVLVTEVGLALGSGALALAALLGNPPAWTLYAVAGWMSALNGLQRPSIDALTPRLVDRDEMPAAAALAALRGSVGMIAGPALGGALIASAGLAVTYGFDLLTYVFSFFAIRRIRAVLPPESEEGPSLKSVLEGFRYARSRQELIGTYFVDFVAMVFGMPLALFPALSERLGGPKVLGLLYAAPACGALVASLTGRWTHRVHRHGLAVMLAATAWGVAIVAFGFCDRVAPAVVFLALAGGSDAVSGMFRMTLWNQTIPDALRGRLAGIEMVSYMSGPLLGHVEAGLIAAAFSVRTSVVSGGVLCVAGVLLCGALLPRFVGYDARRWAAAQ
ncbi:MAG TPA: MFS transporter [Thermoanaerobaculia bacterium]|jgi:MFS family permease|nr:MFS transporter [Thermoanaerobaculia bacterium]